MYKFLTFGFPIYLILFELLFRSLFNLDTSHFIGPALAASGLSLIIGLVKPKPVELEPDVQTLLEQNGQTAKNLYDERLIFFSWLFILAGLLTWYWSCNLVLTKSTTMVWIFPLPLFIGLINYIIGISLTTIKEIL